MTDVSPVTPRPPLRYRLAPLIAWGGTAAIIAALLWPVAGSVAEELASGRARLHAPDAALWFSQSIAVQVHVYAAASAFAIGLLVLAGRKGAAWHRWLGWAWVGAMAVTAGSSLFIMELNPGFLSLVHLFSGWTLIALPMGVYVIRRRDVRMHRQIMVSLFVGGLLIAGALTALPGRLLWRLFLG